MVKLSNSPYEATVLTLEARKSFSLRIELHDRHGNLMSWDNLSATFTLGTLDPLEALLEIPATDGVFRIQASELNLKPRTYQFTITLRSRGYSFVIVKGDVKLVQNTEASSMNDLYGAAIPSETIAVQLDQMNVLKVSLRNTPLTLGTGGGGPSTWSELVGKPLVFPPAQHVHDQQDVGGLVQALADLTASLDGKAPSVHTHPISGVTGLQAALEEKANTNHTHPEYSPTSHSHTWDDITGKPAVFPADARAGILGTGADLNTYKEPGAWIQHSDYGAGSGANYPNTGGYSGGLLEVNVEGGDFVFQRYTQWQLGLVWARTFYRNGSRWERWELVSSPTGTMFLTTPAWASSSPPVYSTTAFLTKPFTPPPGYGFEVYLLTSSGFTFVSTASYGAGTGPLTIRITQFHSASPPPLTLGWRLTRID